MRLTRTGLCAALIVSLTIVATRLAGAATAPATMWLTTPDQANLLSRQPAAAVGPGDASLPTITVDPGQARQPVDGFGASMTESSAHVISASSSRDAIMRALFDRTAGIGLSYLRQPIGASDFVVGSAYTYDDGASDLPLSRFSIDRDTREILPRLRDAEQLNPDLRIMATPWSPPAWMKTGGSLVGGQLKDDDQVYRAYAQYFIRFLRAYADAGVRVDTLTVQNEPQNRHPGGYPGTDLRPPQEARLIAVLGQALTDAHLPTRILAYDHNWDVPQYPTAVLADPDAARYLAGTSWHCYAGEVTGQLAVHDAFPDKSTSLTECSSRSWSPDYASNFAWNVDTILGALLDWSTSAVMGNLALDPLRGPHVPHGCPDCRSILTIDTTTDTVAPNPEYDALAQLSKAASPGAQRIASPWDPTGLHTLGFANPDHTHAIIVSNPTTTDRVVTITDTTTTFTATLPAGALATYRW